MSTFIFLAALLLLLSQYSVQAASTPWSLKFNRDFITGEYYIASYLGVFNTSAKIYQSMTFVNTYAHTLQAPVAVYYTTKRIHTDIHNQNSSYNASKKNVEYYLEPLYYTTTYLQTNLTGFLYNPQIYSFTFNFLIVLNNSRIFGTHVLITPITFTNTTKNVLTPLPTSYTPGDDIQFYTMLRDLKLQFKTSDSTNYSDFIEIDTQNTLEPNSILSSLTVPPYFDFPDSNYSFRFVVLAIDQTQLNAKYPNYLSYSQYSGSYTNNSGYFYPGMDLTNSYNTFFGGMSGLSFNNTASANFFFYYSWHPSIVALKIGCDADSCIFNYSFWATSYFDCNGPQWVLNGSNCWDSCPAGQFLNFSSSSCMACSPFCVTCYDYSQCKSCNASQNRLLVNMSCVPVSGYYDPGAPTALICDTSCVSCNNSATFCTSCSNVAQLVTGSCVPCSQIWQGCSICAANECLSCSSPYRQINATYCNLPCTDIHCEVCLNSNTSFCLHCIATPHRLLSNNGECLPVCGDGVILDNQECDDGNGQTHDGCYQCKLEPGYTCTALVSLQGYNYTAYCSYHLPINFTLLTQEKLQNNNSLRFVLAVDQHEESFWKLSSQFDSFIYLSAKHSNPKAHFISSWKFSNRLLLATNDLPIPLRSYLPEQLVQISFEYQEQLHNRSLSLSFAFNRSRDPRVNTIPTYINTFNVLPQNNQYAHLYLPETYQHQSTIKTVLKLESILLYICYLISIFGNCKRIIAQAIMVAQVAYAGLVTIEWVNPLHSAVKSLSAVFNPFNFMYSDQYRPFDDVLLPSRLKSLGLYSNFLNNLNFGLLFVLLPLLVGVVLKLLQCLKCLSEQKKQKLSEYSRSCFSDFLLAGVASLGCAFGCSLIMQIKYGMTDLNYSGLANLVICGIVWLIFAVYLVLWLKWSSLFQEYYNILQTKNWVQILFTVVYSYSGLLIAVFLFLQYSNTYATTIVMAYCSFWIVFLVFCPIYIKTRDRVRVQLNLVTIVLTQSAYQIDVFVPDYSFQKVSSFLLMGSMIIPIALGVNLLINLGFVIYELAKLIGEWVKERKKKDNEDYQKQYISQKSQQIKKICSNGHPITHTKFTTPLLNDTEVDGPKDASDSILRDELNKFLEIQKLHAENVLKRLAPVPRRKCRQVDLLWHEMQIIQKPQIQLSQKYQTNMLFSKQLRQP